jgi:hypothetical protein
MAFPTVLLRVRQRRTLAHTRHVPFACQDKILTCNRSLTFTCRGEARQYKRNFATRRVSQAFYIHNAVFMNVNSDPMAWPLAQVVDRVASASPTKTRPPGVLSSSGLARTTYEQARPGSVSYNHRED